MKEVSKKTGVIIWSIISIIFAVIYTLICKNIEIYNNLYLERILVVFCIAEFLGLHVIIGFKNLWDFIIDKRNIIALICLVLFTVLEFNGSSMGAINSWILEKDKDNTILGTYKFIRSDEYAVDTLFSASQIKNNFKQFSIFPRNIKTDMFENIYVPIKNITSLFRIYNVGYIIPSFAMAYSFVGNFKLIASLLITYEFFIIITQDKKYLSLIGTILILGSSFVCWWFREAIDIIALGELSIILLDKYMLTDRMNKRLIYSLFLAYSITSYILILYPAWQISLGYVFLAIAIWVCIKNRKEFKFKKIDFACLGIIIGIISLALIYFYFSSYDAIYSVLGTSYPGARNEIGGNGLKYLFSYLYSFKLPFIFNLDTMKYASFLSFFPIPIIMALIYMYKKEKHIEFILPMLVVMVLETIWCVSGFPSIISKITLLSIVPVERCAVAIGFGSIYLYIYMIANIDEKFIKQTNAGYIVLAVLILLFFIPFPESLNTRKNLYIFLIIETVGGFVLLNFTDKRYKNLFLIFAVIMTLISGITVNPIAKGIEPITETDFAKAVQEVVEKDSEGLWVTENIDMPVSNYLVAQGAKTLNATQTYPSEYFWKKILEDKKDENRDIWNRYAHIRVLFTKENNKVCLNSQDKIVLYLNKEKLKDLNIHYIVSYKNNLENYLSVKKIYEKKAKEKTVIEGENVEGIYIYEFVN